MKRLVLSNIALALLSSSVMANAADLTANTTVTTTVQETAGIQATYTEVANIPEQSSGSMTFGKITVSGYAGTPALSSIKLTDPSGRSGVLTFGQTGKGIFAAEAFATESSTHALSTNGSMYGGDSSGFAGNIFLKTDGGNKLSPGVYTDNITLTIRNQ
ncbi:hypothetical protein I5418_21450 [Citrobacter braakii]|uniref:hypothetical protein n=1 Tax=Citrobacter braakii TaxID=57706 RepID=UPI001907F850|nr:hypothetical protein [Citrobacter braakii]MBJ8899661.1 hypothetical protein [Citrobacter braakii]